jgi:Lrp/AsnC family transcriptional regulator for asnA, asnC and gidA
VVNSRSPEEIFELDDYDLRIIAELQVDGRRSYGKIAQNVGLSETAVRRRTQRMIDHEVMRIVAVPNASMLGMTVGATLAIVCGSKRREVIEILSTAPAVDFLISTAGRYDILAEVQCQSYDELLEMIENINTIDGASPVDCLVHLKYHKQTYPWPPGSTRQRLQGLAGDQPTEIGGRSGE